jgi:hypothetical protein
MEMARRRHRGTNHAGEGTDAAAPVLSTGARAGSPRRQSRGVMTMARWRPPLTVEQILAWADEHFARTGEWPDTVSGLVGATPGERWGNLNRALVLGLRGLPGGTTLARLLAARRGGSATE